MKKVFNYGIGLILCLSATVMTGCDKDKEKETTPAPEIEMVYVAGGTFMMGATDDRVDDIDRGFGELPAHEVTLDSFYIGKYEVTQAQWEAVMGTTLKQQFDKLDKADNYSWNDSNARQDCPMRYVRWEEAVQFCERLSRKTGKTYRLPTEAEWEYAARGGQHPDGTKYAGSNDIDEVAWSYWNSPGIMHPVGQKKPNGLGLYDMTGNVEEWCSDFYNMDFYEISPSVNPQCDRGNYGHVLRGGDANLWIHSSYRVTGRNSSDRAARGFRIVLEP